MFSILRPFLFNLDPETAHDLAVKSLKRKLRLLSRSRTKPLEASTELERNRSESNLDSKVSSGSIGCDLKPLC